MKLRRHLYRYAELDMVKAALLLYTVKEDRDRLDVLLELQRHLIRCIIRVELRIQRLKRKRKALSVTSNRRLSKEESNLRKSKILALRDRERELSHLLFLWRCFGDGIAFIYQSKYSLKHLYFDSKYEVKESAGFMTEHKRLKPGFAREYRIFLLGIKHQVPVVLSDVTNIVRYGDVCALGGPDPLPIEVKSSNNRNARTQRQDEQRMAVAEFFANDGALEFRGVPNVKRVSLTSAEVDHRSVVNECMSMALETTWHTANPEPGLVYLVCSRHSEDKYRQLKLAKSTLGVAVAIQPDHLPSYPLTLSLTPANCLALMQRRLSMFVFIDLSVVKAAFALRGVHATILMNGTSSIQLTKSPESLVEGVYRISELLFLRVATEFLSLEWFIDEYSRIFDEESCPMAATEGECRPGLFREVPQEWAEAVDCYL